MSVTEFLPKLEIFLGVAILLGVLMVVGVAAIAYWALWDQARKREAEKRDGAQGAAQRALRTWSPPADSVTPMLVVEEVHRARSSFADVPSEDRDQCQYLSCLVWAIDHLHLVPPDNVADIVSDLFCWRRLLTNEEWDKIFYSNDAVWHENFTAILGARGYRPFDFEYVKDKWEETRKRNGE